MERESSKCLPAGTYYIGDPCYALSSEDWNVVLEDTNYFEGDYATELRGRWLVAFNTNYGDGEYRGSDGFAYGVDAGLIGAVPVELVDPQKLHDIEEYALGRLVTFDRPLIASTDGDGLLTFGDIVIDTRPEEEEDEEEGGYPY